MSNKKNSDNKSNKKQNTKNMKINEWPRHGIQALWAFITTVMLPALSQAKFTQAN